MSKNNNRRTYPRIGFNGTQRASAGALRSARRGQQPRAGFQLHTHAGESAPTTELALRRMVDTIETVGGEVSLAAGIGADGWLFLYRASTAAEQSGASQAARPDIGKISKLMTALKENGFERGRRGADAVIERTPIRAYDPMQERLRQRAATAVLNGTEWLTSSEVDSLAPGAGARSNAHARAHRLLSEGRVFAIEHGGKKRFPRYAFDALGNPWPALRAVLRLFGDAPALRVASWFESTSAALDGARPRELLERDGAAVLRAAEAHLAGPLHG